MYRLVAAMLVIGTVIGAMMPAGSPPQPPSNAPAISVNPPSADSRPEPPEPLQQAFGGEIRLERQANGHFYAQAQVNGMAVDFLVDTGASGVALTRHDAQRIGLQFNPSQFEVVGSGASGDVFGTFVTLDRVSLGGKTVRGIGGVILDGGEQSLLGQNFLAQFGSVEIKGDTMILR